jgi:hypothetical protein
MSDDGLTTGANYVITPPAGHESETFAYSSLVKQSSDDFTTVVQIFLEDPIESEDPDDLYTIAVSAVKDTEDQVVDPDHDESTFHYPGGGGGGDC